MHLCKNDITTKLARVQPVTYLFTTLTAFPMLIAQGSQTSLLSSQTLGFLERLAHRLGTNLCVLVVPFLFFLSISTRKDEERVRT